MVLGGVVVVFCLGIGARCMDSKPERNTARMRLLSTGVSMRVATTSSGSNGNTAVEGSGGGMGNETAIVRDVSSPAANNAGVDVFGMGGATAHYNVSLACGSSDCSGGGGEGLVEGEAAEDIKGGMCPDTLSFGGSSEVTHALPQMSCRYLERLGIS